MRPTPPIFPLENPADPTPPLANVHRLKSIAVIGGFLNGVQLDLADGLNCIIGARGTDKTTALELVRFAIDALPSRESQPAERRRIEALVEKNLAGGRVELHVETKDGLPYTITRAWGDEPIVLAADGSPTAISHVFSVVPDSAFVEAAGTIARWSFGERQWACTQSLNIAVLITCSVVTVSVKWFDPFGGLTRDPVGIELIFERSNNEGTLNAAKPWHARNPGGMRNEMHLYHSTPSNDRRLRSCLVYGWRLSGGGVGNGRRFKRPGRAQTS